MYRGFHSGGYPEVGKGVIIFATESREVPVIGRPQQHLNNLCSLFFWKCKHCTYSPEQMYFLAKP